MSAAKTTVFSKTHYTVGELTLAMEKEQKRKLDLCTSIMKSESPFCDVKIGVKDENGSRKWIGANKTRLMEQSKFFAELFSHHGSDEKCEELELEGISEVAMRAIVSISYGVFDSIKIDKTNAAPIIYAAQKYLIECLIEACDQTLKNWCGDAGDGFDQCLPVIIDLYKLGMSQKAMDLAQQTRMFESGALLKRAFESTYFLQFPKEMMFKLLGSDDLPIDEGVIWDKSMIWCKKQKKSECDQLMEEFKSLIRFPLMDCKSIGQLMDLTHLFSSEQVFDIFLIKSGKKGLHSQWNSKARNKVLSKVDVSLIGLPLKFKDNSRWKAVKIASQYNAYNQSVTVQGQYLKETVYSEDICNCPNSCTKRNHILDFA